VKVIVGRVVAQSDHGPVVMPMGERGVRSSRPHASCPEWSWCQPPEIALMALQRLQPLPRR